MKKFKTLNVGENKPAKRGKVNWPWHPLIDFDYYHLSASKQIS